MQLHRIRDILYLFDGRLQYWRECCSNEINLFWIVQLVLLKCQLDGGSVAHLLISSLKFKNLTVQFISINFHFLIRLLSSIENYRPFLWFFYEISISSGCQLMHSQFKLKKNKSYLYSKWPWCHWQTAMFHRCGIEHMYSSSPTPLNAKYRNTWKKKHIDGYVWW